MEIRRSKVAAKKLWRIVRLAFLLIKKGLISKRKLIAELTLAFKRSRLFVYHRHSGLASSPLHGHDYEFSCSSNSPDPVFTRVASRLRKQYHFPCLASPLVLDRLEYSPSTSSFGMQEERNDVVLVSGDQCDEAFDQLAPDWGSEDGGDPRVDDEAEEFIRRFYEQLRSQNRPQLLQC